MRLVGFKLLQEFNLNVGLYRCFLLMFFFCFGVDAVVIQLDSSNIDATLANNEIVFVNFYADWCRFSQHLKPIFEEASKRFEQDTPGHVAFASVDCDRNPAVGTKYHVNKYPTLKLFRNGELIKKEYRGQRSAAALAEYIQKQAQVRVEEITSDNDLQTKIDNTKRNVIGYIAEKDSVEFKNFAKVASALRDDCSFYAGTGEWINSVSVAVNSSNSVYFREPKSIEGDFIYTGALDNYEQLKKWLSEKCIPMVREITFENAEELTEEGLPFLILFRTIGDAESEKIYSEAVFNELSDQKASINCLMADGKRFAHPLHHLGKSEKDLPVIAIDSFRHMYLFPDFENIRVKGLLRQFVMDLHSGKLHREFHHGPDPVANQLPRDGGTQPPESVFKQLKPSESRYSLLQKEEL